MHLYVKDLSTYNEIARAVCSSHLLVVPTLEATYFLTRWLLPFDVLDWRMLRAVVSVCGPPLLKDEFRGANGQLVNEQTVPTPQC